MWEEPVRLKHALPVPRGLIRIHALRWTGCPVLRSGAIRNRQVNAT